MNYENIEEVLDFVNNEELDLEGEIWCEHPIYKGNYGSNLGRIRYINRHGKLLIRKQMGSYYRRLKFSMCFVKRHLSYISHRFIAECFCGINKDLEVDHVDSNPLNNRVDNLRFVDKKTNMNNPNTKKKRKPSTTHSKKIRVDQIDPNTNEVIKVWDSIKDANKYFGKDPKNSGISQCCQGKQKTAYGFNWRFHEEELLPNEIFKQHPTIEGIEGSTMGRIRYLTRSGYLQYTEGCKDKNSGYLTFKYKGRHYKIHRLIAEIFLENLEGKPFVNHIDTNKQNNCVENLEWVTQSENMLSEATHKKTSFALKTIDLEGKETLYRSIAEADKQIDGISYASISIYLKTPDKVYEPLGLRFERVYVE